MANLENPNGLVFFLWFISKQNCGKNHIGQISIGGKGFENFDFPIVGSKIQIVVDPSVTYENLSVEKYKINGKKFSSIRLN